MTPLDRAQFEAEFLTGFFEWLEPENIDRFPEEGLVTFRTDRCGAAPVI
jgi:hypothetical protein